MYVGTEEEKESWVVTFLFYFGTGIKLTAKNWEEQYRRESWMNIRNTSGLITQAVGAEGGGRQWLS